MAQAIPTPITTGRTAYLSISYTIAIFTSATLLFLVQPMFARMALPLLGGSPAVWNTALVFYQAALLAGYGYAHLSTRLLPLRYQLVLHLGLLLLPLLVLPLAIPPGWAPPATANPIPWLLGLLLTVVGLPFVLVSTSSPLLQRWFAASGHPQAADPYFLYAASNLGSMLALLSYPLLLEPNLRLADQSQLWSVGYGMLVVLLVGCAAGLWRMPVSGNHSAVLAPARPTTLPWRRVARWVLLAFIPSSLMVSVTNYISTEIAPVPLLWVLPLALYLLTFILVFARRPPLPHQLMVRAMPFALLVLLFLLLSGTSRPLALVVVLHLLAFFVVSMVCHGALAQDRPAAQQLTTFYLWQSFGGVLGGAFNALLAPLLFSSLAEYPLVLALAAYALLPHRPVQPHGSATLPTVAAGIRARLLDLLLAAALAIATLLGARLLPTLGLDTTLTTVITYGLPVVICGAFMRRRWRFNAALLALLLVATLAAPQAGTLIYAERSFFGIHRVIQFGLAGSGEYHGLLHGSTLHGTQSRDPQRQRDPLNYYHRGGPVGQALAALGPAHATQPVAVVGLGAGALACYAQPGQTWDFYEIDPAVERIARNPALFSYLQACAPTAQVLLGDARLALAEHSTQQYGILVLDAYSSDSPPLHLLTREALQIYLSRLAPGGVLIFHASNRHFDFEPVLAALAQDAGLTALLNDDRTLSAADAGQAKTISRWVVMARSPADLAPLTTDPRWRAVQTRPCIPVWTDDFSSLLTLWVGCAS